MSYSVLSKCGILLVMLLFYVWLIFSAVAGLLYCALIAGPIGWLLWVFWVVVSWWLIQPTYDKLSGWAQSSWSAAGATRE